MIPSFTDKHTLFWSVDPTQLDAQKHKQYIIHQVLQFGSLADYKWLETLYGREEIRTVFIEHPRNVYLPKTFHFIKNFLIKIIEPLDQEKYVTTIC